MVENLDLRPHLTRGCLPSGCSPSSWETGLQPAMPPRGGGGGGGGKDEGAETAVTFTMSRGGCGSKPHLKVTGLPVGLSRV